MMRAWIGFGFLVSSLWMGCRSTVGLGLSIDARGGELGSSFDTQTSIERNAVSDARNPCETQPFNQAQATTLFQEFGYRDQPTYHPNSTFSVEELPVPGAWEVMGVQLFSGGTWNDGYVINSRPFVIHACKLYPLTQWSSTELLSAILVNRTIYYSIQAGSGINYSELGKLSLVEDELHILKGADYGRPDPANLYLREVDGNILVDLGTGMKFNTWNQLSIYGWLRDDGVNLIVVDAEGNELPHQGEGEW
jgi:hypothetical protein